MANINPDQGAALPEGREQGLRNSPLLDGVDSPADLRLLEPEQLPRLAAEIRDYILQVVAANGGHLASSLGAVELTLALHYVYNTPVDKLIWDVGHQSYTHKIITGRREAFVTLRQQDGLSGFPNRRESEYDCFNTGHSSTSLSAALGMAKARDLAGQDYDVAAVIGDGALTSGLAFEALDCGGAERTRVTFVLNDNRMSITNNVGALSDYLLKMRTNPHYGKTKRDMEHLLNSIPRVGPQVARVLDRAKDSLKYFLVPGMLFEEMGFIYLGPIDGHDIDALIPALRRAKGCDKPVIVHVLTQKGRGYPLAEQSPERYHGVGPFDLNTGLSLANGNGAESFSAVFGQTLCDLAAVDEDIVAVSAAMAEGTGLSEFAARFPERFIDVGIAESHAVTFAGGLAAAGKKPVVAIYSTFLQRGFDQIFHDVCLPELPVVFAVDRAGLVGEDGVTHQGIYDLSYLRLIPGLSIMAPRDGAELRLMLKAALKQPKPVAIRYPRGKATSMLPAPAPLRWGKAELLREGDDLVLFAAGPLVREALLAAERLWREHHLSARVFNARFVAPLDAIALTDAARVGKIAVIEENSIAGGLGSAVLEFLQQAGLQADTALFALPKAFIPHGRREDLLQLHGLDADSLAESIYQRWFKVKKKRWRFIVG